MSKITGEDYLMDKIEQVWNYKTLTQFKNDYYGGLITENMSCGDRMFLEKVKHDGEEIFLDDFFFPYRDGKDIYLIPHNIVKHLPVKVSDYKFVAYNKSGYILPEPSGITKMKIEEQKVMSYPELLDKFANFESTNPEEDEILRIITLVSYIDRINVAISGRKASGKTSRFEILANLMGNVKSIGKPSMAKLKYELRNRTLVINEVNNLTSAGKDDVEMFFLDCGDMKEQYTNNTRAAKGTDETFDISKLSLILLFNTFKEMGYNKKKFFHTMWDNEAVPDRFLPIEIQSSIKTKFTSVFNVKKVAEHNKQFYIDIIRTIRYMRNDRPDRQFVDTQVYEFEKNRDRWEANFNTVCYWIDVFSRTQEEYDKRVNILYKMHQRYMLSLSEQEMDFTETEQKITTQSKLSQSVSNQQDRIKLIEYIKEEKEVYLHKVIEKFDIDLIKESIQLGEIIEQNGKVRCK